MRSHASAIRPTRALAALLLLSSAAADFRVKFNVVTTDGPGSFTVKVHEDWAPLGAARFQELVEAKFYDDSRFYRVIPGYMVQFGLAADPAISAKWRHATIKDDPVKVSNKQGYITFATSGNNSRTTQLFINYGNNTKLDGMGFAPFGEVEGRGMDVVSKIFDIGERPEQERIQREGNEYFDKPGMRRVSKLVDARILADIIGAIPPTPTRPTPPTRAETQTDDVAAQAKPKKRKERKLSDEDLIAKRIKLFDADKTGYIERKELGAMLFATGRKGIKDDTVVASLMGLPERDIKDGELDKAMARIDRNEDGRVSGEELLKEKRRIDLEELEKQRLEKEEKKAEARRKDEARHKADAELEAKQRMDEADEAHKARKRAEKNKKKEQQREERRKRLRDEI